MPISFQEAIQRSGDNPSDWTVEVEGRDVSNQVTRIELIEEVNNPVEFNFVLQGLDLDADSDVLTGNEAAILYKGVPAALGLIENVKSNSGGETEVIAQGFSARLNARVQGTFTDTNTDNIVETVMDQTQIINGDTITVDQNERLNTEQDGVVDFRVQRTQLEDITRLLGEYGGEYFIGFDSGTLSPTFNVVQQRGGGAPVETFSTSEGTTVSGDDKESNSKFIDVETDEMRGEFEQVVVNGYGDGDNQIRAIADENQNIVQSLDRDKKTLNYTDKTIITERQAEQRARQLSFDHTVTWASIKVKPDDPNRLFTIGDVVRVDDNEAGIFDTNGNLSGGYRVIDRYYTIKPAGESELELTLSNKPATFLSEFQENEQTTRSQTDFMQGSGNTLSQPTEQVAEQANPAKLELVVPERFVNDVADNNRLKEARLDVTIDDFRELFRADSTDAIDSNTKLVDTTVSDFGDVERAQTQRVAKNDLNETIADLIQTDTTTSGAGGSNIETNDASGSFSVGDNDTVDVEVDGGISESAGGILTVNIDADPGTQDEGSVGDSFDIGYDVSVEDEFGDSVVDVPGGFNISTNHHALTQSRRFTERLNFDSSPQSSETQTVSFPDNYSDEPAITVTDLDANAGADVGVANFGLEDTSAEIVVANSDFSSHDVQVSAVGKTDDFTEYTSGSAQLSLRVPEDTENREYTVNVTPTAPGDIALEIGAALFVEDTHVHQVPDSEGSVDNVQAFTEASDGGQIDAGDGADQNSESLPNEETVTFDQLSGDQLILDKESTSAGSFTVRVDGTEIAGSPFSLSGSAPFTVEDIDLGGIIDSPGQYTLEIEPDAKAFVRGDVTISHKKDEE
jgi:hypothetical protein